MHQKDVAMAFFYEALRLAPHDSRAIACALQNLIGADRLVEAERMAVGILTSEKLALNRIIAAKAVLLVSGVATNPEITREAEQSILSGIAEIGTPDDEFIRDQVKFALLALTMFLEATGRINEAVSMCDRALTLDQSDPYAHELKGALMVRANPDGASNDIRRHLSEYFDVHTHTALHSLAASLN